MLGFVRFDVLDESAEYTTAGLVDFNYNYWFIIKEYMLSIEAQIEDEFKLDCIFEWEADSQVTARFKPSILSEVHLMTLVQERIEALMLDAYTHMTYAVFCMVYILCKDADGNKHTLVVAMPVESEDVVVVSSVESSFESLKAAYAEKTSVQLAELCQVVVSRSLEDETAFYAAHEEKGYEMPVEFVECTLE